MEVGGPDKYSFSVQGREHDESSVVPEAPGPDNGELLSLTEIDKPTLGERFNDYVEAVHVLASTLDVRPLAFEYSHIVGAFQDSISQGEGLIAEMRAAVITHAATSGISMNDVDRLTRVVQSLKEKNFASCLEMLNSADQTSDGMSSAPE